jgi:hypothetical protein
MVLDLMLLKVEGADSDLDLYCLATLQDDLVQTAVATYEDGAHVWNQDLSL